MMFADHIPTINTPGLNTESGWNTERSGELYAVCTYCDPRKVDQEGASVLGKKMKFQV